jgi:hypothetical protein
LTDDEKELEVLKTTLADTPIVGCLLKKAKTLDQVLLSFPY